VAQESYHDSMASLLPTLLQPTWNPQSPCGNVDTKDLFFLLRLLIS